MSRFATARDGAFWTLTLTGVLGFWLGATAFPNWQVAVETAQVVARLVTYPPDNPFYVYHVKLWTVLHEALAVLLRAGVTEVTASKVMSGALGMVSLQALSTVVYAFSRSAVYATGAGLVLFVSRASEFGGRYPINLMGTSHTYGAFGLSSLVLAAALLGAGRYRLGGLLLGAMPAIHPSLGIWLFVILAITVATDLGQLRVALRPALPWFIAGCAVTALSLAAHVALAPQIPAVERAVAEQYLSTLVTFWDGHRRPAHLDNPAVYLNAVAVAMALTWLRFFRDSLPRPSLLLLRFVVASGAVAIGFIFVSWAPPEWIPEVVKVLMPLRLLNIVSMIFPALLVGLAGARRRTPHGEIVILILLGAMLFGDRSQFWGTMPGVLSNIFEGKELNLFRVMMAGAVGVTILAWIDRRLQSRDANGAEQSSSRLAAAVASVRTVIVAAVLVATLAAVPLSLPRAVQWRDRTHDPVFAAAASGRGLLLTGNALHLIQLKTRRPVLLDGGGLDGLAYSLDAGPAMNRILRDVYGLDLLNPPEEARGTGSIPPEHNRRTWQAYSPHKWQEIRREYNVTQVLTARNWELDLPVVAETLELRLYEIPDLPQ